jgi:hypothetical protein
MLRLLREPLIVFRNMNRWQHLYYWLLPLLAGWLFTAMYFSGVSWMQEIIAPASNREFGLLENLGAVLIVCSFFVVLKISMLPMKPVFKVFGVLTCLVTVVMFLEEIDYGLHFIEWMKGIPHGEGLQIRNFHNRGNNTNNLKTVAYVTLLSMFMVMPYVDRLKRHRLGKVLVPSKMILFTVLATALVALLHEALDPYGLPSNGSLDSNQSEFEEVVIYYTFFVYFREKYIQFRKSPELLTDWARSRGARSKSEG